MMTSLPSPISLNIDSISCDALFHLGCSRCVRLPDLDRDDTYQQQDTFEDQAPVALYESLGVFQHAVAQQQAQWDPPVPSSSRFVFINLCQPSPCVEATPALVAPTAVYAVDGGSFEDLFQSEVQCSEVSKLSELWYAQNQEQEQLSHHLSIESLVVKPKRGKSKSRKVRFKDTKLTRALTRREKELREKQVRRRAHPY